MAAIELSTSTTRKPGTQRLSTRVDMTPMVDLGFLLITFFMLATTMSQPTSMSVFFPDNKDNTTSPVKASGVLTLFLGADDHIFYLDGIAPDDEKASASLKTVRSGEDLRKVIFSAQGRVRSLPRSGSLVVVIKPTDVSNYKTMVDVMDEMAITRSNKYALVDELTASERKILGDRIKVREH